MEYVKKIRVAAQMIRRTFRLFASAKLFQRWGGGREEQEKRISYTRRDFPNFRTPSAHRSLLGANKRDLIRVYKPHKQPIISFHIVIYLYCSARALRMLTIMARKEAILLMQDAFRKCSPEDVERDRSLQLRHYE